MTQESVVYSVDAGVATVMIHRPDKRNALDFDTLRALQAALHKADAEAGVKAIVVTGAGDASFCAGGDLGGMRAGGFLEQHEGRRQFANLFSALKNVKKPTFARVNGTAYGGGFGVALACDFIVAASHAKFATPEIKVGLYPFMVMAELFRNLPRKVGLELCMTGRPVSAEEGKSLGFVNRVAPEGGLDACLHEFVGQVTSMSPAIVRLGKEAFYAMSDMPYDKALDYLHGMLTINTLTDDAAEGIMAFIQKRPPEWKGQ